MIPDTYQYTSLAVGTYLICRAREARVVMNITKLMKLLYVAYGLYLARTGQRLTDEYPKAWPYGPVFPRVRRCYLREEFEAVQPADIAPSQAQAMQCDKEFSWVISVVIGYFGPWNAGSLTEWSHKHGGPWELTTRLDGFKYGWPIPDEWIYAYFQPIEQDARKRWPRGIS